MADSNSSTEASLVDGGSQNLGLQSLPAQDEEYLKDLKEVLDTIQEDDEPMSAATGEALPITPAAPGTPTKTASSRPASGKYTTYSDAATDEEMFAGNPDLIAKDNIFRLSKTHPIGEIARRILEKHPDSGINPKMLSNRLLRAKQEISKREGREKDELSRDLSAIQKSHGISMNGKRKAAGSDNDGTGRQIVSNNKKKKKATILPKEFEGDGIADSEESGEDGDQSYGESDGEPAARFRTVVPGVSVPPSKITRIFTKRSSGSPNEKEKRSTSTGQLPFDPRPVHRGTFRIW